MKPADYGCCATCRRWGAQIPSNRVVKHQWAPCGLDKTGGLTRDDETCPDYASRTRTVDVERMDPEKFGPRRKR